MSAREEILARIAAAHRIAPPEEIAYADIPRDYRRAGVDGSVGPAADLVELLVDRLVDYKALVRRCSPADLAGVLTRALTERGVRRLVVPSGLPGDWLVPSAASGEAAGDDRSGASGESGPERLTDMPGAALSVEVLDGCDGVLTGCAVAIAETGTLVLDASPDQGRRVISLIPDYHLVVVRTEQIVGDVPEALTRLDPVRPLTLISGPSATSDIELNRVEGVHGPRTLEVVVVG